MAGSWYRPGKYGLKIATENRRADAYAIQQQKEIDDLKKMIKKQ